MTEMKPVCAERRASLDEILATNELESRQAEPRVGDESAALLALARSIAGEPRWALQRLAESVLALTSADASGVSVVEVDDGMPVFRWRAAGGAFKDWVGQTMPRSASPCGDVLRTSTMLLMREPARHYASVAAFADVQMHELLLVPFKQEGAVVGTVWAAMLTSDKQFNGEDARLMESVSTMAAANDLLERITFGNPSYSQD
ncbi:MAG TPA: GAF domain-containing protein [Albitalea sp.]|jgi:transcriptional regulator with GAF, ATPase, and Fis domain|nr:GAF domain-containing protein [Albitalea sp.]